MIQKDGKVLLARHAPGHRQAGIWEFPGGKVEAGESAEQALAREIWEELSVTVRVLEKIAVALEGTLEMWAYRCEMLASQVRLTEHDCYEWVAPEQLSSYAMSALDRQVVPAL